MSGFLDSHVAQRERSLYARGGVAARQDVPRHIPEKVLFLLQYSSLTRGLVLAPRERARVRRREVADVRPQGGLNRRYGVVYRLL